MIIESLLVDNPDASVRRSPDPRCTAMRSLPLTKPTSVPSGDQKGSCPPSLPGRGVAVADSSERIQMKGDLSRIVKVFPFDFAGPYPIQGGD